jgi:AAHS family 4-hydroxybenzoate transporter-like MFS transporter
VLGAIANGYLMSRFNAYRVIAVLALITAALCAAFGQVIAMPSLIGCVAFMTGFTVCTEVGGMNFTAADYYPTVNRATGVSWMLRVGQLGPVGGAMAGGIMQSAQWDLPAQFLVASVPFVIAAISIFTMRHMVSGGAADNPAQTLASEQLMHQGSQLGQ